MCKFSRLEFIPQPTRISNLYIRTKSDTEIVFISFFVYNKILFLTFLTKPFCSINQPWSISGILISSSVVPIALSILWARATATGLIAGVIGGCACGITTWLTYASQFEGGLSAATFVRNTGEVKFIYFKL